MFVNPRQHMEVLFLVYLTFCSFGEGNSMNSQPQLSSVFGTFRLSYFDIQSTFDEAQAHCNQTRGSVILVNTSEVRSALKSFIILKNHKNKNVWEDNIWTKVLIRNNSVNCTTAGYQWTPKIMAISLQVNASTNNQSSIKTKWKTVNSSEKNHFVCKKEIDTCIPNNTCNAMTETKVPEYGFDLCFCNQGYRRDSLGECNATETTTYSTSSFTTTSLKTETSCSEQTMFGFVFPTTPVNEIVHSRIKCDGDKVNSTATIRCTGDYEPVFDLETFQSVSCNVTLLKLQIDVNIANVEELEEPVRQLQALVSREENITKEKYVHAATAAKNISQAIVNNNIAVSENIFAEVVETVSHLGGEQNPEESRVDVVKATETIVNYVVLRDKQNATFRTKTVFAQIAKVDFSNDTDHIDLPLPNMETKNLDVSVKLPLEGIMQQIDDHNNQFGKNRRKRNFLSPNLQNVSAGELREFQKSTIKFIIFKNSYLPFSDGTAEPVISIQIGNLDSVKLKKQMTLNFLNISSFVGRLIGRQPNETKTVGMVDFINKRCAFFDFKTSQWRYEGLCMGATQPDHSLCYSNHLTSFSLLVTKQRVPSDVALDIFSQVGCGVIVASLLIAIALHLANREMRSRMSTKIRIHLYFNMLLAYSVFFAGIERVGNKSACNIITVVLHYTFLASFFWMAVYANRIYSSLLQVFSQASESYMWKAGLFSYGAPALIIGSNVVTTMFYFDKQIPSSFCDNSGSKSHYFRDNMCWVNTPSLYYTFFLIVGLVLVYNGFVITKVSKSVVFTKKKIRSTVNKKSSMRQIGMITTLAVSVGITWLFAYFLLFNTDEIYQTISGWVFAIVTSSQGIVLVYLSCFKSEEMFQFWYQPFRKLFHFSQKPNFNSTIPKSLRHKFGFSMIYSDSRGGIATKTQTTLL